MLWSLIDQDGMVEIVATDWGWKMQDGTLVSVMTDQDYTRLASKWYQVQM